MTKKMKCRCKNAYQDKKYGRGVRVFNKLGKGGVGSLSMYRCTVCLNEK